MSDDKPTTQQPLPAPDPALSKPEERGTPPVSPDPERSPVGRADHTQSEVTTSRRRRDMSDDSEPTAPEPQPQTQPLPQPDPTLSVQVQNGETPADSPGAMRLTESPRTASGNTE